MADRKYYVLCEANCKFESMTKEQILTAIEQAISKGEIKDVDTGFVTTLKEQNSGKGIGLWIGSQAEYNADVANGFDFENVICIFTDDTTEEDLLAAITDIEKDVEALQSGKAPYQLTMGTYSVTTDEEIDNVINAVYSEMPNNSMRHIVLNETTNETKLGGGCAHCTIYKTTNSYGCLKVAKYSQNRVETMERSLYGGVWGDWCIDNPVMNSNVEYKTTERWKGLPVYKKIVSYTIADKIDATNTYADVLIPAEIAESFQIIRCSAVTNMGGVLPYVSQYGGVSSIIRANYNGITFRIYNDIWGEGITITFELAYVKI